MSTVTSTDNYRALTVSERIELVEDIWDSIAQDTSASFQLSPEQCEELDRRLADHLANPGSALTWDEVRNKLFAGHS